MAVYRSIVDSHAWLSLYPGDCEAGRTKYSNLGSGREIEFVMKLESGSCVAFFFFTSIIKRTGEESVGIIGIALSVCKPQVPENN